MTSRRVCKVSSFLSSISVEADDLTPKLARTAGLRGLLDCFKRPSVASQVDPGQLLAARNDASTQGGKKRPLPSTPDEEPELPLLTGKALRWQEGRPVARSLPPRGPHGHRAGRRPSVQRARRDHHQLRRLSGSPEPAQEAQGRGRRIATLARPRKDK